MTLRSRLAVLFGLIMLASLALVYLSVAPRLGTALRDRKLADLAAAAQRDAQPLQASPQASGEALATLVREASSRSGARVVVLANDPDGAQRWILREASDAESRADSGALAVRNTAGIAERAVAERVVERAVVDTEEGQRAQVALPLLAPAGALESVVVFSTDLGDVEATVAAIRRQLVVSGLGVLALALIGGFLVARALAGRVKRLEAAARKVAAGDFSEPVVVDSEDELGQLAAAFAEMQGQLGQLDSARRQFIATASHELRTPVFSLGGFLELLEDEELDPATRAEFLGQVRGQVDRLRMLSTELLDLSRLESGVLELHPEPTDVGALTQLVAGDFAPALRAHASSLDISLPKRPVELDCDPDRVGQVLRILLDNALSHTPEGTSIAVSVHRAVRSAIVEVHDDGPGIRRDAMPHIFEPFYSSDDVQGSGLGLAIARELAERMRGELAVASRPGSTTFSLRLPT